VEHTPGAARASMVRAVKARAELSQISEETKLLTMQFVDFTQEIGRTKPGLLCIRARLESGR